MITLDESDIEVAVTVELDVLGYTTTTIARKQATQTHATVPPIDAVVPGTGRVRMAPQATVTVDQPLDTKRISEYKAKYGPQGSGGWEPLHTVSPRPWVKPAITFIAAFITAGSFYVAFSNLPPLAHTPLSALQPPWFTVVLIGLVLFTTLGVLIANWFTTWKAREALSRISTSLFVALVLLSVGEAGWYQLFGTDSPVLHFIIMLFVTSLAATVGALPRVSDTMIKGAAWGMRHARWLMIGLAMLIGGVLGFALTNGLSSGCFTPFGVLLGIGIGGLLVARVDRLMKQKTHP